MKLMLFGSYKAINKKGQPEDRTIAVPYRVLPKDCKVEGCKELRQLGSSRCKNHSMQETIKKEEKPKVEVVQPNKPEKEDDAVASEPTQDN